MRLNSEFVRLRCQFDPQQLRNDLLRLAETDWKPHPQGFIGNAAVPLVARDGDPEDDRTWGRMLPTANLAELPYIRHVLGALDAPLGRTRLMRVAGESLVPSHTDLDYYWQRRMRVHIPIVSEPGVIFECGHAHVQMRPGEAWIFDTTQLHRVLNPNDFERIHLVADTVGSQAFSNLIGHQDEQNAPALMALAEAPTNELRFESQNRPLVMSPHEQRELLAELCAMWTPSLGEVVVGSVARALQPVLDDWNAAWAEFGPSVSGLSSYQALLVSLERCIAKFESALQFRGSPVRLWLERWLVEPALDLSRLRDREQSISTPVATKGFTELAPVSVQSLVKPVAFDSEYTESLPRLIEFLGGSLALTTYASDRLVLLRSSGAELNTHFKQYPAAMGLAFDGARVALGAANSVWQFRPQPELGRALQPNCDAVYVPTKRHMTGDIRVHELAWGGDTLWVVNTRFSCLASLDDAHSFVPRWYPRFLHKLSAEDACHLNGLAMREGQPAWVSALGASANPGGWRQSKLDGGVVIEVASGEVVSSGLCMPHSPRWHAGALWVLDSGHGELCKVDLESGNRDTIVRLPGFARGLAMVDQFAFVGCSRVREAAWFGGLPVLERGVPECGVWAIDLNTGKIIGWLKFAEGIDEVFDLQWLPQLRWPDILEPDEEAARNGFAIPAESFTRFQ